jgi:hypothetical protein
MKTDDSDSFRQKILAILIIYVLLHMLSSAASTTATMSPESQPSYNALDR